MQRHLYTLNVKKAIKSLVLTGLVMLVFSCLTVNAQRHSYGGLTYGGGGGGYGGDSNWGIFFMGGYDVPQGDLAQTFKGSPTFGIGVNRNFGNFTISTALGYFSYKPKLDTFYYQNDDATIGGTHWDNFSTVVIYVGAQYNVPVSDGVKFYAGINIGAYYDHYAYTSNDENGVNSSDQYEEEAYFAPKLGINFAISNNVTLGVEGKYNFFSPETSTNYDYYNDSPTTQLHRSFTGNVVLTFGF